MSNENFLVDFISAARDISMKRTEKPALDIPKNLTTTQKKLAEMLMEHVPTSILDSGGAYGYGYQRARENPVWKEPESYSKFSILGNGVLDVCLWNSTFHLLSRQLEYNAEWDKKFQDWRKQFEDDDWEANLDKFPHPETGELCNEVENRDWYGKGWKEGYTYNDETLLDRDVVYYKYDNFVIIQIHGGCDARCGFTEPVLFELDYCDEFNPFEGASIICPECNAYWDYGTVCCNDHSENSELLDHYPCEKGTEGKVGTVVVTDDHKAFCPVCGKGRLE